MITFVTSLNLQPVTGKDLDDRYINEPALSFENAKPSYLALRREGVDDGIKCEKGCEDIENSLQAGLALHGSTVVRIESIA